MTLNLTSIERAPKGRYYTTYPVPTPNSGNSLHEVVECDPGQAPRQLCVARFKDAEMIADALNHMGEE